MKKVFVLILLSLSMAIPAFSNLKAVNGDKLPLKDEVFSEKSTLFMENFNYSSDYHFDWRFNKPKEQVIDEVKDFYEYLGTVKKSNYDVKLLRLITMRCLYNLDAISSDEIKDYADQLKKKYKKDFRTWWIYGNFLSTTTLISDAYDEFMEAMRITDGYVNSYFLRDYVYVCHISGNIKHGWLALNQLAEMDGIPIEEEYFYDLYAQRIVFPKVTDNYSKEEVWKVDSKKDGTFKIFSTLVGVSVPAKPEWSVYLFEFEKGQTALTVAPERFTANDGTKIGVTSLLMASANENAYEMYKSIVQKRYETPVKASTKKIGNIEFEVFEGEDMNSYVDVRNGQRGIYLIGKIPYNEKSGIGLESSTSFPLNQDEESNGPRYFKVNPVLDRIPETVTVMLMLDSCNAIYKDSSEWFWDFAENSHFE